MRQGSDLCIALPSLIPQDSHCYVGPPGKFLRTGILAGTRLRKFYWFVSIDKCNNAPPVCWREPRPFCSLLCGPSCWVYR